ncbi:retrovirus-related pol polyprotein from transposon TNT 1-94 [Tanacetum coccineum]
MLGSFLGLYILNGEQTTIEESKDITSLSLDELIRNLKVHEMIIKKDSEIVKAKGERKSLALKAKKESSDEECSTSGSKDEEYAMAVRDFKKFFKRRDPNHLIRECPKLLKDKNQRAFVGGSWSDSGEEDDEKVKNETCLVAQASNEICLRVDLEPDEWIKDSGCSKHMTGNRKLFSSYKAYNGGNVIFGSNLRGNIIGKGQICDHKCRVTFSEHDSEITKDGKVIGRGIRKKGLYVIKLGNKPKDQICLETIDENSMLWHRRLGHANMRLIQSLASKELVRNLPKLKFDQHFCDAFKIGKQAHASHKAKNIVSTTRCLELLHMDLFSPSAVRSYRGNRYTIVIVDDYSRYPFDYRVTLGFGSIAGGLDLVNPVIRLPIERGINSGTRVGTDDEDAHEHVPVRETVCMIENHEEVHKMKAQEDEGDMDDVQPYMPLGPVHDKEKIVKEEEQDYDIPLHDGVVQPLTPHAVHITPPDDDYVAPATNPILDKQLNEFRKECSDITRVAEKLRLISTTNYTLLPSYFQPIQPRAKSGYESPYVDIVGDTDSIAEYESEEAEREPNKHTEKPSMNGSKHK